MPPFDWSNIARRDEMQAGFARIDRLEGRFDLLEERFDFQDQRIDRIEHFVAV